MTEVLTKRNVGEWLGGPKSGDEKAADLERSVKLKSVKVSREFKANIPTAKTLLKYLDENSHTPKVFLSDGRIIISSREGKYEGEFGNEVAEIFAKENKGVYFPKHIRTEAFLFKNYIDALKICISRMEKNKTLETLDPKINRIHDLEQEAKYLYEVKLLKNDAMFTQGKQYLNGVEGRLYERKGKNVKSIFGPDEREYKIKLALDLDGFGERHFHVCGRRLAAEIDVHGRFKEESEESAAIYDYLAFQNRKAEHFESCYGFNAEMKQYKEGIKGSLDKVRITMESPSVSTGIYFGGENRQLGKGVAETEKMLFVFEAVVNDIAKGIISAESYRKNQRKTELKNFARAMSLPGLEEFSPG